MATARKLAENLSAHELSLLLGGSPSVIAMIERGDTKDPRSTLLGALAVVLGISIDWLITGKGPKPKAKRVRAAVDAARANFAKQATKEVA